MRMGSIQRNHVLLASWEPLPQAPGQPAGARTLRLSKPVKPAFWLQPCSLRFVTPATHYKCPNQYMPSSDRASSTNDTGLGNELLHLMISG